MPINPKQLNQDIYKIINSLFEHKEPKITQNALNLLIGQQGSLSSDEINQIKQLINQQCAMVEQILFHLEDPEQPFHLYPALKNYQGFSSSRAKNQIIDNQLLIDILNNFEK